MFAAPDFSRTLLERKGCRPFFEVKDWGRDCVFKTVFSSKDEDIEHVEAGARRTELSCGVGPSLTGDVQLSLLTDHQIGNEVVEMCHVWFHTGFVEPGILKFRKRDIDMAHKDSRNHFPHNFRVHVILRVEDELRVGWNVREGSEPAFAAVQGDGQRSPGLSSDSDSGSDTSSRSTPVSPVSP